MADANRAVLGRIALRRVPACAPAGGAVELVAATEPRRAAPSADALRLPPAALRAVLAYLAEG